MSKSFWNHSQRRISWPGLVVALVLCLLFSLRAFQEQEKQVPPSPSSQQTYRVKRVVDGDTLLMDDGTRVRLLGVDTPETKHPTLPVHPVGVLAAHFTRKHVEGKQVRLQFDKEKIDQYQRVLAYVYLDDWMLNEELIREGYSKAETRFKYSNSMKRRFLSAEKEARQQRLMLWNDEWKDYATK